jgi:hypothetical protein
MNRRQLLLSGVALLVLRKLPTPAAAAPGELAVAHAVANERIVASYPWLPLDGRTLTRQQYPELHTALTQMTGGGLADAATDTFSLPDLRARGGTSADALYAVGAYRPPPDGPTPETLAPYLLVEPMIRTDGEFVGTIAHRMRDDEGLA